MKKHIIKIASSIFFVFVSIICLLLSASAGRTKDVDLIIKRLKDDQKVYVNDLSINSNIFLMDDLLDYDEENEKYYYRDEIIFKITNNDVLNISFEEENVDYATILINEEEVMLERHEEDNSYSYHNTVSRKDIIKYELKNYGILRLIYHSILLFVLYFGSLFFIEKFLDLLFSKKFDIRYFLLAMTGVFALMYFNMRTLISVLGIASIVFVVVPLVYLIIRYHKSKNFNYENSYLLISLIIGLAFMFILPPFMVPDEDNHFIKSYDRMYLSSKDIPVTEDGYVYTHVSKSTYNFYDKYSTYKLEYGNNFDRMAFFEDYSNLVEQNITSSKKVSNGQAYANFLTYIPSFIFVHVCKYLNTSVYLMYMLGRFINYVIFLLITYYALKILPKFKYLMFIILTFGIMYQQAIGYNQDWLNNCCLALLIAYIMNLIFVKKKVEIKDYIVIGLLNIGLAFSKSVYTLFSALILLVDNKKFITEDDTKKKFSKSLIIKIAIIAFAGILGIISMALPNIRSVVDSVGAETYSLSYFLHNPIRLIIIVFKTFIARFSLDSFRGFFDGFGWSTMWHLDFFAYLLCGIYFLLILFQPYEKFENKKEEFKFKGLNLILMILIYIGLGCVMLFGWTNPKYDFIDGLQPRYFIPAIFSGYLCLNNSIFKANINNTKLVLTSLVVFANIVCLCLILFRIYI